MDSLQNLSDAVDVITSHFFIPTFFRPWRTIISSKEIIRDRLVTHISNCNNYKAEYFNATRHYTIGGLETKRRPNGVCIFVEDVDEAIPTYVTPHTARHVTPIFQPCSQSAKARSSRSAFRVLNIVHCESTYPQQIINHKHRTLIHDGRAPRVKNRRLCLGPRFGFCDSKHSTVVETTGAQIARCQVEFVSRGPLLTILDSKERRQC